MNVPEIYNAWLGTAKRAQNAPWRPRKDFSTFESTPEGVICKRLELFFKKLPQISPYDFFQAPYIIYKDETYFPLNFYTTQKAIAVYNNLLKQRKEESPDTEDQINDIKKTLKYIGTYCVNNKITLEQYCQSNSGYVSTPFVDYANGLINIYVLIKLPFFETNLNLFTLQDKEIYLKGAVNNIAKYKMRLNASVKAKDIIDKGIQLITKITKTNKIN